MRAGASWGNLLVYIPTKTWKQLNHVSIDNIFLDLLTGSRKKEGNEPFSELDIVTWYLFSTTGLVINLLFHILERSLSDTQASMGRLGLGNNCASRTAFMTGSSPYKADCVSATDPCTTVSDKPEEEIRGKPGNWWADISRISNNCGHRSSWGCLGI